MLRLVCAFFVCMTLNLKAEFFELDSLKDLQQVLSQNKNCIIAIGLNPCIPCENLKKHLASDVSSLPDVYWINIQKLPKIRHLYPFKALPYITVYREGKETVGLTGEKSCMDYLSSFK